jgi:hypothetical protein
MENKVMKFELDEKQIQELNEWKEAIKKVFGEYGSYDYIFSPNGIGYVVKVYSHLAKTSLNLTDIQSW